MYRTTRPLLAALALVALLAFSGGTALATPAAASAAASPVTSSLTCGAKDGRTAYTITGTLTMPNVPSNLTISWSYTYLRCHSSGTTSNVQPVLDNTLAGGYYLTTYGYNAWKANNVWLLLPSSTWGAVVNAGFSGSGSNVPMTCVAPDATGVTGALTCSAWVTGDPTFYIITGTVVAPSTLTTAMVSVRRSGVTYPGTWVTPVFRGTVPALPLLARYDYNVWGLGGSTLQVPAGGLSPSFSGIFGNLTAKCTIS
jgi:hypothetical protein